MKKLSFLMKIKGMLLFITLIYVTISCSDDDRTFRDFPRNITNSGNNFKCGINMNDSVLPKIGDTRTYYVITDLTEKRVIWGAGDSICSVLPFIKEENLLEHGIQILSDSNTGDSLKVNFIEGYKGLFIGYKLFVEKDTLCCAAMGEPRRN